MLEDELTASSGEWRLLARVEPAPPDTAWSQTTIVMQTLREALLRLAQALESDDQCTLEFWQCEAKV